MSSTDSSAVPDQPSAGRNRLVLIVYTAAIFVSALLLFSVQPLFTKMVLPRLGGSPAVWSVAMVFFQSLLLAGYGYAHYLIQIPNRRVAVTVHLLLLVAALLSLPLSIASGWGEPPTSGYALWLLGLFAVSIMTTFTPDLASAANQGDLPRFRERFALGARRRQLFLPEAMDRSAQFHGRRSHGCMLHRHRRESRTLPAR